MDKQNFLLRTLGCRVNQAESRKIGEDLSKSSLTVWRKNNGLAPSLIVINSCAVTNKALRETRKEIRHWQRKFPKSFIIVCGCAISLLKKEDFPRVFWLKNKDKIDKLAKKLLSLRDYPLINVPFQSKYQKSGRALVKIQNGCDNFCSYCIVPYVRGHSKIRDFSAIIKEIKKLEKRKIQEVILTGVDIASVDLTKLMKRILGETKIKKISFGSINLACFTDEFIESCKNRRVVPRFHIPLQSGCNKTLKRMRRKYTAEDYKLVMRKLRREIPRAIINTDIIVGFPGETEKEWRESLKNIKALKFAKIHVFRYSRHRQTLAGKMEKIWGAVPEKIKIRRAKTLLFENFYNISQLKVNLRV